MVWELVLNRDSVSVWEDEQILEMDGEDGGAIIYMNVLNATEKWFKCSSFKCKKIKNSTDDIETSSHSLEGT